MALHAVPARASALSACPADRDLIPRRGAHPTYVFDLRIALDAVVMTARIKMGSAEPLSILDTTASVDDGKTWLAGETPCLLQEGSAAAGPGFRGLAPGTVAAQHTRDGSNQWSNA